MLQNSQNLMQSKAACCGTRTWLATFRRNTLSPFSDMREEPFYFLFVIFVLCLLFVCFFLSFFLSSVLSFLLSYSNQWDLKFYTTRNIFVPILVLGGYRWKIVKLNHSCVAAVSAAIKTTLNYTLLLLIFRLYRVYQNDWSGFEVDYIHKYGEQNYKF